MYLLIDRVNFKNINTVQTCTKKYIILCYFLHFMSLGFYNFFENKIIWILKQTVNPFKNFMAVIIARYIVNVVSIIEILIILFNLLNGERNIMKSI